MKQARVQNQKLPTAMKAKHRKFFPLVTLGAIALVANPADAATIALGDTIVVDFGKTGQETTGNWNNVAAAGGTALSGTLFGSGTIKRFSDGAMVDGLSLSRIGGAGVSFGIGGADVTTVGSAASFTVSGTIPDNAQNDTSYVSLNSVTLVIGGLSSSLNYNLEILSMIDVARSNLGISVNGATTLVDPNITPWVTAFNGISANGSNEIVISFPSSSGTELQHINAFELTAVAVPEPSAALLGAIGMLFLLRRRRV
jgi:hypothetical protein